jgi:hypothetical protein
MRKILPLILATITVPVFAQDALNQGFEGESLAADNWTTISATDCKGFWEQVTYASDSRFNRRSPSLRPVERHWHVLLPAVIR